VIYIVSEVVISELVVATLLFMIFLGGIYFLIGLVYHYIRNKTYLNVLIESIIIGLVLAFPIRLELVGFIEWVFFCFLAVFAGGVLAIIIRRYRSPGSSHINKDHKMDSTYKLDKIDKSVSLAEKDSDELKKSSKVSKPRLKRVLDTIPHTPVQEVKIFNYNLKKDHAFKRVTATADPNLSEEEAINEINDKLKEMASDLGGNAVIKVRYNKRIFNLFGPMKGNGSVVYIKDLDNVERIYPSHWPAFLLGGLWLFVGLMRLLDNNITYYLYFWLCTILIFNGFFIWRGYKNKTYFLGLVSLIGLWGAFVIQHFLNNGIDVYSYFGIGFFTVMMIALFYEYYQKDNNPDMPWKDEWKF